MPKTALDKCKLELDVLCLHSMFSNVKLLAFYIEMFNPLWHNCHFDKSLVSKVTAKVWYLAQLTCKSGWSIMLYPLLNKSF